MNIDAAELSSVTTGLRIGTALGINIKRDSALDDGKHAYYDADGNSIATDI
jgi:hypothetical protein